MSRKFNFTKKEFENFRKDYADAVKSLEEKYGLEITVKNITYDKIEGFYFKTNCNLSLDANEKEDKERKDFCNLCKLYGLKEEDYGREITIANKLYRIKGIMPSRRKYPMLLAEKGSNNEYAFTLESVIKALENK